MKIRIKCVNEFGNVSYLHQVRDTWVCSLADGTAASMFYAGIHGDEMGARFALEDTSSARQAIEVIRKLGSPRYTYSTL